MRGLISNLSWARLALVAPLAALPLGGFGCDQIIFKTDCVTAVVTDLEIDDDVASGLLKISVPDDPDCPAVVSGKFISYRDVDGEPGYDASAGDVAVNEKCITSLGTSTKNLEIGVITTGGGSTGLTATHWFLQIDHVGDKHTVVSGTTP